MKRRIVFLCVLAAGLVLVGSAIYAAGRPTSPVTPLVEETRIQQGMAIAPVPLDTTDLNVRQVARGSYIVNGVAGCNDCHTCPSYAPGHNPFDGVGDGATNAVNYLAGGVNFGIAVSANLTPDENGLPAGLTHDEFVSAIRTGHDPEDDHILQVMPWPVFRNMIDTDLDAVYQYLSSIPHAEPGTCGGPGE
jgi:hypothetical protein